VNYLESRVERLEQMVRDALRRLGDALERLKRLEDRMASLTGGGGGGGGGASGVYYSDYLNIAAHSSGTGEVFQSWDGTSLGDKTILNVLPDATTNTKRQLEMRNPDGTFTIISESCSDQ
jgi:ABC-type transporter Mla subunit MlaD